MKTPLKSEPSKFEWQWCFLYNSLFYAAFWVRIFCFLIGLQNEKMWILPKSKIKTSLSNPIVRLFKFNSPESHRIFPFFLFRSLVLYLWMWAACVIKHYFLFIINKILYRAMRFLEANYTYKHKIICYNNSANRFDNSKILMYN